MTQVFSGNGWPAYKDTSNYTRFTAGGQKWWAANDDVAVVFTEFVNQFIKRIEPIAGPILDDWSYANRLVRGSTSVVSNHGSATAIDLNALQHPRGVANTFTKAERATMHAIRDSITDNSGRPVLRLGLDYKSTVDDMHVEINANAARVKQAANKIRERNKPKPPVAPVKEEDIVASLDQMRQVFIDVLTKEKIVPNKVLDAGAVQGDPWTTAGVQAALDQKADFNARANTQTAATLAEHTKELADLKAALAGKATAASVAQLGLKIDALIAALTPPSTK